jgi:hypothetical protein
MASHVILLPRASFVGVGGGERRVLCLPPPAGVGAPRRYVLDGAAVLELQQVAGAGGSPAPASWFVDQSVVSSGAPLVATPVDLGLWLLPALRLLAASGAPFACAALPAAAEAAAAAGGAARADAARTLRLLLAEGLPAGALCAAMQPYVDAVAGGEPAAAASGAPPAGACACARGARFALNEARAAQVLAAKAARVARALQARADRAVAALRAAQATFSSHSVAVAADGAAAPAAAAAAPSASDPAAPAALDGIAAAHWEGALEALGEYLSPDWARAVRGALAASASPALRAALPPADDRRAAERPSGGSAASAAAWEPTSPPDSSDDDGAPAAAAAASSAAAAADGKAAKWNALALEEDSTLRFTRIGAGGGGGGGGGEGAAASAAKPKPAPSAPTLAHKRLAATNTKGMKPIAAFFGGASATPKK